MTKQYRVERAVALASYLDFYQKYAHCTPQEAMECAIRQLLKDGYE
jgi:hypothetical protein